MILWRMHCPGSTVVRSSNGRRGRHDPSAHTAHILPSRKRFDLEENIAIHNLRLPLRRNQHISLNKRWLRCYLHHGRFVC